MPTMPACPECGGKVWDNRESKKNKRAPDFKCRDKKCEGVIWPDDKKWGREGTEWKANGNGKPVQHIEAGPGKDAAQESREDVPPVDGNGNAVEPDDIEQYLHVLEAVGSGWAKVAERWPEYMLPRAADVQAAAATIIIDKQRRAGR